MLPYDDTATGLLHEWNAAMHQLAGARRVAAALPFSSEAHQVLCTLEQECATAKTAHHRYRYQQANPTHPVSTPRYQVVGEVFHIPLPA